MEEQVVFLFDAGFHPDRIADTLNINVKEVIDYLLKNNRVQYDGRF